MKPDSDETSGFKVDSFTPKCNQAGCICYWNSQFLSEWFHATKVVTFRIEGVNFDTASCVTVTRLFLADGGSLVGSDIFCTYFVVNLKRFFIILTVLLAGIATSNSGWQLSK